jgi:hypothetical protein
MSRVEQAVVTLFAMASDQAVSGRFCTVERVSFGRLRNSKSEKERSNIRGPSVDLRRTVRQFQSSEVQGDRDRFSLLNSLATHLWIVALQTNGDGMVEARPEGGHRCLESVKVLAKAIEPERLEGRMANRTSIVTLG